MSEAGTDKLPKPPRRCEPEEFFCQWVPEAWGAARAGLDDVTWPPLVYDVEVRIDNQAFRLAMNTGTLAGRPATDAEAKEPLFTVRSNRAAWELSARDVTPRIIRYMNNRLDDLRADLRRFAERIGPTLSVESLRELPGRITIDFTDDAGDRGVYELTIGSGQGPTAKVVASDEDLWALLDARGKVVNLLRSRINIQGDVAYVIRLATHVEGE